MEIRARVTLSLLSENYRVVLKYETLKKATYDTYLVTSIVANSNSKKEAFDYIDDITGNGSLNPHFKKLYNRICDFNKDQIQNILSSSLFPTVVIDDKNIFKYYPMLNVSKMNYKIYEGNLKYQSKTKDLLMPKENDVRFLDIDFIDLKVENKQDTYDAIFSNDGIKINIGDGVYRSISDDDFKNIYHNDIEDISLYQGKIGETITTGKWYVLNNVLLKSLKSFQRSYCDQNGNVSCVYDDRLKKYEIIKVFSLYFYKETIFDFNKNNIKECNEVVDYLLDSKSINEFKTKNLVRLLNFVDDLLAQKVVNYILLRKDSKEIAEVGLKLIKSGLEKNWDVETLKSIKKYTNGSNVKYLYKIDSTNISYSINDLLEVDDVDLNSEDKNKKILYLQEKENIKNEINRLIGEITTSGVREKMKKLTKDEICNTFKKFLNNYVGHSKKSYDDFTLEKLQQELEHIKDMYNNYYLVIINRIKQMNN